MTSSKTYFGFVFLLAIFLVVFDHVKGDSLIKYVCSKTTHPRFCAAELNSDQESSTADMHGLANIALLHAQGSVSGALVFVSKMLLNATRNGGDTRLVDGLSGCKRAYISAAYSLDEALKKCAAKAYSDAKLAAGRASADIAQCEFAISKGSAIPFPPVLALIGKYMVKFANLSIDIIDLLISHHTHTN